MVIYYNVMKVRHLQLFHDKIVHEDRAMRLLIYISVNRILSDVSFCLRFSRDKGRGINTSDDNNNIQHNFERVQVTQIVYKTNLP